METEMDRLAASNLVTAPSGNAGHAGHLRGSPATSDARVACGGALRASAPEGRTNNGNWAG